MAELDKNMKNIQKNTIIGGVIGIIFFIIFVGLVIIVCTLRQSPMDSISPMGSVVKFFFFISMPAVWVSKILGCDGERGMLTLLFCLLFYYAIIGALVGLIFTMIKEKRKNNRKNALESTTNVQEI